MSLDFAYHLLATLSLHFHLDYLDHSLKLEFQALGFDFSVVLNHLICFVIRRQSLHSVEMGQQRCIQICESLLLEFEVLQVMNLNLHLLLLRHLCLIMAVLVFPISKNAHLFIDYICKLIPA